MSAGSEQRKLAAIMFTDMVGYSALSQRDDKLALELLEEHRRLLREIFPRFNGTEIKTIGDAFLVEFGSALEAAQCAIEIQRTLAKRNHDVSAERRIELKIGIHIGDVVHRGGDVYGDGVNIASRIEALAGAGGICVSMDVERQIRNTLEARFEKLAPTELKNISVAMDLFRIVLPWEQPSKSEIRKGPVRLGPKSEIGRQLVAPTATKLVLVGVIGLAVIGTGWWLVHRSLVGIPQPREAVRSNYEEEGRRSAASLPVSQKSIAVLPFENLSEEKANAYFADGIQDEILTKLAGIGDLKVISRSSTAKYKSKPEDLKTAARELGVGTVLEGSVQKAGDRVRVNVQLIDARIDTHLWAKSYDRDLKDIFAVESEVAQEIADTLRAKLSPSQSDALATAPTRDTQAYDLFLKGEYEEHQAERALNAELFDRAQSFYRQALARDRNFALAYARLAYTELLRHWFISNLTSAELAEIRSNIDHALAIAPASPDAHLALAVFYYWGHRDYDPALRELDRTLELQPNNANARVFYASIYRRRGEWQRALTEFERAAELDPRDSQIPGEIGSTYIALRRWSDAEHALTRALAMDPHNALADQFLALTYIHSAGDIRRARRAYEGVPTESKLTLASAWGVIAVMIDHRVYLDVFEKHFADALKAWDTMPTNTPEAHLRKLEARVGIQVLAGQGAVAKPECEQTRTLLEARLAERPEDRNSLTALAWAYVCLGRNADALHVARQAADLLPIEKDALAGPFFLAGLAEVEARTGRAEDAVKILRQLITAPAGQVVSIARLKIDPVWDPIRNDPGFQKLISEPEPETVYK